jgi:MFS family permease
MLLVGLVPHRALLGVFIAAALSQGLKGIFDAALQSLVGSAAPPAKRGQYTGLVELAWGGSSLIGLPVAGALLDAAPRSMFLVLGAVQLLPAVALRFATPLPPYEAGGEPPLQEAAPLACEAAHVPHAVDAAAGIVAPPLMTWRKVLATASVQRIAFSIMLVVLSVDCATICFGVWLQEGRGLDTSRVAAATLALGFADFGGELLARRPAACVGCAAVLRADAALHRLHAQAALVIDRLGTARAMLSSCLIGALAAGALAGAGDVPGTKGATTRHACVLTACSGKPSPQHDASTHTPRRVARPGGRAGRTLLPVRVR